MKEVAGVVLVSDFGLELGQFVVELISFRILGAHLSLQVLNLGVAVILQPLLVLLELDELIVEHLNLFLLSSKHIFVVPLESEVVHLGVTLVAYAI